MCVWVSVGGCVGVVVGVGELIILVFLKVEVYIHDDSLSSFKW